MVLCSTCNVSILVSQKRIKCTNGTCFLLYHIDCVNYNDNSGTSRSKWICLAFTAIRPSEGNTNTSLPTKNRKENSPDNLPQPSSEQNIKYQNVILNEIRNLRMEMKEHFDNQQECLHKFNSTLSQVQRDVKELGTGSLKNEVDKISKSMQFFSYAHDAQTIINEKTEKTLSNILTENNNMRVYINDLNTKMSQLEQQARDCNVEIQCVSEHKNENLITEINKFHMMIAGYSGQHKGYFLLRENISHL
ncbi:unnamed protein product, partial [Brenthis ino]